MDLVDPLGLALRAHPTLAPDGSAWMLLVAKCTFLIPVDRGEVLCSPVPDPIVEVDLFEGAPGLTPPLQESDLAALKPRCEVLLSGSAHAPQGRAAAQVAVALCVGGLRKTMRVTGARHWRHSRGGLRLDAPEPFVRRRISYARAYGGADLAHADAARHACCAHNPVGTGFHVLRDSERLDGQPALGQEPLDQALQDPWQAMPALAFGPIGRNWQPRLALAGTFDEAWLQARSPFLPLDFDPLHWQAAPPDQQTITLDGGLPVELHHLTPEPLVRFQLPDLRLQALAHGNVQGALRTMRLDTLLLEPDRRCFTLVWRTHWSLQRHGEIDRIALRAASAWPRTAPQSPYAMAACDA